MPEIRPITDLRNTTKNSKFCNNQDGYCDLVITSIETYERQLALVDVYKKLHEAEVFLVKELLDGKEVFKKLRQKHEVDTLKI